MLLLIKQMIIKVLSFCLKKLYEQSVDTGSIPLEFEAKQWQGLNLLHMLCCYCFLAIASFLAYRVSQKNPTDLNNSNGSCFLLVSKQLFLLKFAIIRINFDIFSSIFGDLVIKLKISKVQTCFQVKTRGAALAIGD